MKRLSKIYKKGCGLIFNDDDVLEFEEEMIMDKIKKQRKKYLNPNAKAFMHKFLKKIKWMEQTNDNKKTDVKEFQITQKHYNRVQ